MKRSEVEVEIFTGGEGKYVGKLVEGYLLSEDFTIWVDDKKVYDSKEESM